MFRDKNGKIRGWVKVAGILVGIAAIIALTLWVSGATKEAPTATVPDVVPATQAPKIEPTEAPEEVVLPEHGDEEPQPQIGHPSIYVETGTEGTRTWTLEASSDEVIILGGWAVDGTDGGVYRAIEGPQKVEVTVTDGFALIIVEEWARDEFCFRVAQAREFGWAANTIEPLPQWEDCK